MVARQKKGKKRGEEGTNGASSSIFIEEEEKGPRPRKGKLKEGREEGVRSRFLKAFNDILPE